MSAESKVCRCSHEFDLHTDTACSAVELEPGSRSYFRCDCTGFVEQDSERTPELKTAAALASVNVVFTEEQLEELASRIVAKIAATVSQDDTEPPRT